MHLAKWEVERFRPFQEFLDTFRLASLPIVLRQEVDLTGDGINDTCITRIALSNGVPLIEHQVVSLRRLIWRDTLSISDDVGAGMYWSENESLYVAFRPFTGLYIAQTVFSSFVGNQVNADSPEGGVLIHSNPDLARYLQHRRGPPLRWIWLLDHSDPAEMVWDQRVGRFVLYHAP
jgi:hypothetical protein